MTNDDILDMPDRISEYQYGGFWIRLVASLIDSIILLVVNSILQLLVGGDNFFWIISTLVGIGYYVFLESGPRQATVGKMILDLKVVSTNYERISVPRALGRYFAKMLSVLPMMIGLGLNYEAVMNLQENLKDITAIPLFLAGLLVSMGLCIIFYGMAAIHPKKQAMHDRIANCYVIINVNSKKHISTDVNIDNKHNSSLKSGNKNWLLFGFICALFGWIPGVGFGVLGGLIAFGIGLNYSSSIKFDKGTYNKARALLVVSIIMILIYIAIS